MLRLDGSGHCRGQVLQCTGAVGHPRSLTPVPVRPGHPLKRRALILIIPLACSFLGCLLMFASGAAARDGMLAAKAGDGVAVTVLGRVVSPATTGGGISSFFLQVGEAKLKNETYTLG